MLVENTMQLTMEVNNLKETMFNNFGVDLFEDMNTEEFELFQKMFKVLDLSMKVVEEQSKMMEIIDNKLDRLLYMKDRA